ncbi:MAG: hypothetical protein MMC23_004147 [Stictis urceolatum]|nr:hypothetical protein [Stictis urceolata]
MNSYSFPPVTCPHHPSKIVNGNSCLDVINSLAEHLSYLRKQAKSWREMEKQLLNGFLAKPSSVPYSVYHNARKAKADAVIECEDFRAERKRFVGMFLAVKVQRAVEERRGE